MTRIGSSSSTPSMWDMIRISSTSRKVFPSASSRKMRALDPDDLLGLVEALMASAHLSRDGRKFYMSTARTQVQEAVLLAFG